MAIGVERDADVRVTEAFRDYLDVDALFQEQRRVRVAQVVEPDHRQFCTAYILSTRLLIPRSTAIQYAAERGFLGITLRDRDMGDDQLIYAC